MITASPEIAAIVTRWNEAVRTCDRDTVENLLSRDAALRYVGTASGELWSGSVLRRGLPDHFAEVPDFSYRNQSTEAFEQGSTGWAFWHSDIHFHDTGVTSEYRITFIFTLETGAWKIVQIHLSNPTPNFEKLGIEHSALDALMAAARDGFETAGREGLASVMFTDVVDSSALADLVGDRLWTLKINAHLDMVTHTVTRHGGTLVKSLGDGTMSTFPTVRAALDAALSLQQSCFSDSTEPALQLRAGIHTGEVIENKGDFFGTVVNKAARIAASAAPDEIRLSDATRMLLGRSVGYAFADPVDVPLKGLSGMHKTFRLERGSEN